jgi:hypothetical protein
MCFISFNQRPRQLERLFVNLSAVQMRQSYLGSPQAANHLQLNSKGWASKSGILPLRRLYRQQELFISIARSYLVLQGGLSHVKRRKKM